MPATGSLSVSAASVEQGEQITFTYSVPPASFTPKNWVGTYPDPGGGPVDQRYVGPSPLWQYTPAANGTVSFASGALTVGDHIAFYLYDDGYTWLADPVRFTVRPTAPADPPPFRGAFGGPGLLPGRFAYPTGATVDSRGQLWVADTGNNRVQAFDRGGRLLKVITAGLAAPQAVAVDGAGTVYVADTGNNRVAQFAANGRFVRAVGAGTLDDPRGVAVDTAGRLYVSDTGHQRVARYDTRSAAELPPITAQVSSPQGITSDGAGGVWVVQNGRAASGAVAVVHYSGDGTVLGSIGYGQSSRFGGLSNPSAVAVTAGGDAFVTVPDYGWVTQFRTSGPYRSDFGFDGPGALSFPQGVAVDAAGRIFVVDTGNNRIVRFGAS